MISNPIGCGLFIVILFVLEVQQLFRKDFKVIMVISMKITWMIRHNDNIYCLSFLVYRTDLLTVKIKLHESVYMKDSYRDYYNINDDKVD